MMIRIRWKLIEMNLHCQLQICRHLIVGTSVSGSSHFVQNLRNE